MNPGMEGPLPSNLGARRYSSEKDRWDYSLLSKLQKVSMVKSSLDKKQEENCGGQCKTDGRRRTPVERHSRQVLCLIV